MRNSLPVKARIQKSAAISYLSSFANIVGKRNEIIAGAIERNSNSSQLFIPPSQSTVWQIHGYAQIVLSRPSRLPARSAGGHWM